MAKIDAFFKLMVDKKASDFHLSPKSQPVFRINGDLEIHEWRELTNEVNKALLYEMMTPNQIEKFEKTHDIDFAYSVEDAGIRLRCNVYLERLGIGGAFRLIPSKIQTAEELGFPPQILKFTEFNRGLVVVTGSAGCGKSTTLASIIDHINKNRSDHILTIEDPIEFVHKSLGCIVNQRQVGKDTNSFATALRAALREDPDVILIGELRDLETMELAITAAETGHLVFGTLHTTSAPKTIDRIINAFPTAAQEQIRAMLAESLKGVVAQQLVKSLDGGRCAAMEILVCTSAVSNLIREGKTFQLPSILQTGKRDGMQMMDNALLELVTRKKVAPEDAMVKANNKDVFKEFIKN